MKQTIAKVLKPAVISSYIASENRRRSNKNLPPFISLFVEIYERILSGFILPDYFL